MGCNASRSTGVREQSRRKPGQQPLKPMNGKGKASSSPSNKPIVRQSAISAAIFGEQDPRSPRFHSAPTLSSSMDDDHTPMSGLTVNTSRRPSIDDSVSPTVLTSSPGVKNIDHHPLASAKFLRNLTEGEQFRIGLKLSAQEQQYGTNMFDSLQQSDLPELERLVATGITYEDAATYIFERRFQSIHHISHDRHHHAELNMTIARKPPSLAIDEPALLQLPGMSGGTYFDPIVPTTTTTHQNRSNVDEIPQFVPFASFGRKKTSPKSMFSNNSVVPVVQQQQPPLHSEAMSTTSAQQQPRALHGGHVFYQGKWLSPRQRMALQEQELYLQHHQQRQLLQQQWQGQIPGQQVIWHQNASSVPANNNNRPYLQQMLQAPKAHLISGAHQDITQGSPLYMSSFNQQSQMNDMDIYPHSYA
jgi:hypothetical protein